MSYKLYVNALTFMKELKFIIESDILDEQEYIKYMDYNGYSIIKSNKKNKDLYFVIIMPDQPFTSKSADFAKIINKIKGKKNRLIVVSEKGLKSGVVKSIETKHYEKIDQFQHHKYIVFQIIPRNNVVNTSRCVVCTKEDVDIFMEDNKTDISNVPKIYFNIDPIAIWLDAKLGDLIKIYRNDSTGPSIAYRYTILPPETWFPGYEASVITSN